MSEPGSPKSPVQPGDIVAGKYRVDSILGSGGMGVVVAATHLELHQSVALKFILPQALAGKGNVERFMREARAAVRLKSEHVARVYDVGRDAEDRPFMVLELLEGMDLAKLSKQKGSLPVADAVEYMLQACEALVEAHAAGIVHRDLKPQNLFVTRRLNGTPLVKVLDFGIAKAIGPGAAGLMALTDSSAIIGSPLYMAPEQMRSARTAEIRSDIWALGVILFELLGGQLPFDGETVTEVCIRVVNEEPAPLLSLRPALDPALVAIVMRCLEKDPEARWHNVSVLASALEPFSRSAMQGGPVRPWRSFEDTQDSQQGNPFANVADATGPSTAVTIATIETLAPVDDLDQPSEEERRARAAAGGTKVSPGSKGAPGEGPQPLVSTNSTWAESTGSQGDPKGRPRSFSTGMVAAIVVAAAAAAAAGGLVLGRGSTAPSGATGSVAAPASVTAAVPTNASAVAATARAAPAEPNAALAPAAPVTVIPSSSGAPSHPGNASSPSPSPSTAASVAAHLISVGQTRLSSLPRTNQPTGSGTGTTPPASAAPSTTTRPPDMKPVSDPLAPNGAPILH